MCRVQTKNRMTEAMEERERKYEEKEGKGRRKKKKKRRRTKWKELYAFADVQKENKRYLCERICVPVQTAVAWY